VVAVPPDATAEVVAAELQAWPRATVTDVASVKSAILADLQAAGADLGRYVGGHPLAGRERGGAISARADLFLGRPWVITGGESARRRLVEDLVIELGAVPVAMSAEEHDAAVALVSHTPQVVSSLLARRLGGAPDAAVGLAGQGLRDTTRIASSDPELWVQILGANAGLVAGILKDYRADLDALIAALDDPDAPGARRAIAESLAGGNAGVARIPGKHGQAKHFSQLVILVDDRPGELARLLTEIGELGVNMEDLRLEHSPGAQVGLAEIAVLPEAEERLATELTARGWKIAEAYA
ncbi:MAG: prephenate dehydrogenase, partial [Rhodoglobus sp.]